jgi:uncharacterized repeat protein (TIGR03943 family)
MPTSFDLKRPDPHTHCGCEHASAAVGDWAGTALLYGGGMYFLALIGSGNLSNYVHSRFTWIVWIGAAAFFVLAYVKMTTTASGKSQCCGSHAEWKLWLLALPLMMGFLLPSAPLNASSISRQAPQSTSTPGPRRPPPDVQAILKDEVGMSMLLTPESDPDLLGNMYDTTTPDPARLRTTTDYTLLDWFWKYVDVGEQRQTLDGQRVDLVGFVYRGENDTEKEFILARYFMYHCIFDTIPIGIPTTWQEGGELAEDTWVRVRGTLRFVPDDSGTPLLTIAADTIEVVPQPETPYLYPDGMLL